MRYGKLFSHKLLAKIWTQYVSKSREGAMHKQWQKQRDFREDAVMDNDNVPEGIENLSTFYAKYHR